MITWRHITKEDYNCILVDWWKDNSFPPPPLRVLPGGYIISKDGVDIYAGFVYYTGTPIAWLEFVVGNKKATLEQKKGGLEKLVDIVSTIAKDKGVTSLFVSTVQSFANSLVKTGFNITDKDCVQLIKNL